MGYEQRDKERVTLSEKRQYFRRVGQLVASAKYDHGCPKCGPPALEKKYCVGREPWETEEQATCLIVGEHLHGSCKQCGWTWVEHCKDDPLDRDERGGLRYDEQLQEDGEIVTLSPSAGPSGVVQ